MEPLKDSATRQPDLETCEFCEKIYAHSSAHPGKLSRDDINVMFHDYCPTCRPPNPSLCSQCQHMRLRHHLFCEHITLRDHLREKHKAYRLAYIPMDHLKGSEMDDTPTSCIFCLFLLRVALCLGKSAKRFEIAIFYTAGDKHVYSRNGSNRKGQKCELRITTPESDGAWLVAEDLTPNWQAHPEHAERETAFVTQSHMIKELIDWNCLREYLTACCGEHEDCRQKHSQLPSGFRLIDVQNRCLVHGWPGVEFLALSYVWGMGLERRERTKGVLTKTRVEELEHKDSLQPCKLPATIEDAIQACIALGERYLWVDRLCIVQDDPDNKKHQIHAMGSIFKSAKLVIIAVAAENMHTGICGISKVRKTDQVLAQFSGMEVVQLLPNIRQSVERTVWNSRGWTYQEAVLPKRKLWLGNNQAFFECGNGVFPEGNFGVVTYPKYLQTGRAQLHPFGMSSAEAYYSHLMEYTKRSLTFDSDIVNAFTGIGNSLYGGDGLIFGLPHDDFDQALLWNPSNAYAVVREGRYTENLFLPSWTWASVKSQSFNSRHAGSVAPFCGTLVQWLVCTEFEGQPTLLPIKARAAPSIWSKERLQHREELSPHLCLAVAWMQNCIQGNPPSSLRSACSRTFVELDASAQSQWPSYSSFCEDQCPPLIDANGVPAGIRTQLKPGDLVGCVMMAFLTISTAPRRYGDYCLLRDQRGQMVGMAEVYGRSLPTVPNTRIKVIAVSISLSHYSDLAYFDPNLRELGARQRLEVAAQKLWRDREENFTFFDPEGNALIPPPVVNVLLVEQHGEYCRRIGRGWAYLTRWIQAGPVFETVVLE